MKILLRLFLITLIFYSISCGKKSSLDRFPESDYPREYPKND